MQKNASASHSHIQLTCSRRQGISMTLGLTARLVCGDCVCLPVTVPSCVSYGSLDGDSLMEHHPENQGPESCHGEAEAYTRKCLPIIFPGSKRVMGLPYILFLAWGCVGLLFGWSDLAATISWVLPSFCRRLHSELLQKAGSLETAIS